MISVLRPGGHFFTILAATMAVLVAHSSLAGDGEKPLPGERTVISDVPWAGFTPDRRPRVIYGEDDRIDLYEETDPDRRAWARSVCGLVSSSRVVSNGDGTYTLIPSQWLHSGRPPCPDEPFREQPTLAYCSGFLAAPDIIVTAGHCYSSSDLASTRFVFGYVMEDPETPVLDVPEDYVYQGVEILGRVNTSTVDYTVIRVDRPVTAPGAEPLPIRRSGTPGVNAPVGLIGHPAGLPLKLAFGDQTQINNDSPTSYFVANLDAYGGNSGSPVFHQETGIVEGILVRGSADYQIVDSCFESRRLSDSAGNESSTRTTIFEQLIPLPSSPAGTLWTAPATVSCFGEVTVNLSDADLAGDELATVYALTSTGDAEVLILEEHPPDSGIFRGTFPLSPPPIVYGDGIIQADHLSRLTFYYNDADDGTGNSALVTERVDVLCVDWFTQQFLGDFNLDGKSLLLLPDGECGYTAACLTDIDMLPVDPAGGTTLPLGDDDALAVTPSRQVRICCNVRDSFFVNANGSITFDQGDTNWQETLELHFSLPRVAPLYHDLDPSSGGTVSWKKLDDRVAVSWVEVPRWNTNDSNTIQVELFFDGRIRMSWLGVDAATGVVGVSCGNGVPEDFSNSNLSRYRACTTVTDGFGDINRDGWTNFFDAIYLGRLVDDGELEPYDPFADINDDGTVDIQDAEALLEWITESD